MDYGNFVSEDRKKRFPTFRFASNFKRAVAADFIPKGFQQAFYDSMSRGIGRIGTESDKGKIGGISDWVKEKAQTVIGIFPDKDVKIGTARTFYDVGEEGYGKAFNKDGRIKIDKSDEGWNKRMENGGLVPEGSTDSEIDKEKGDLTPTEAVAKARADMLSDAALFDGLKANSGFTNLVVTRQSTWEKGSSIDGKKLLLHEIMTHLSIPQRNRKQNYFPKDEDFSSSEQHNEIDMTRKENEFSIDSRIPMNVYK